MAPPLEAPLDSDLLESLSSLKEAFERQKRPVSFGIGQSDLVEAARTALRVPRRYRSFLLESNPIDCEVKSPSESVRLLPLERLLAEQEGFALENGQPIEKARANGWKRSWVIIAHSTLLGDPYFLDVADIDAEGDCPVYAAMSGTEVWQPKLCASNLVTFLRILAINLEVASGFSSKSVDYEDEFDFREALGPKLKQVDPAALKAGHWT